MSFVLPTAGACLADRYRLERALGEGASSVVFAARDEKLERMVAVKLLKPQIWLDAGADRERFLNEARVLAKLAHPHVAPVFDVGETQGGAAFFVMELVGERTLARELQTRGTLCLEEALTLLLPVMGALAMAHDASIVHRDIKPANVVLEARDTSPVRAKLLDFGIAKLASAENSSGYALGTPAYMAPEQATAGSIRPSTDVWAMGVLLFQCLTGKLPFEAPVAAGLLLKIVHERAPRFKEACPELGSHVAVALDQTLEPNPDARPQNMRQLARILAAACRQDGVRLPLDPDPVGLPKFSEWLRSADVERTAKAPVAVPAKLYSASTSAAVANRSTRALWVTAAVLVGAGSSLFVATGSSSPEPAVGRAAYVEDRSALSGGPTPQLTGDRSLELKAASQVLVFTAPDASKPLPVSEKESKPPPMPKKGRAARARQVPAVPQPMSPSPRLIKQWDW